MFDIFSFKSGAIAFVLAFVVAGLFALAFKLIYQWLTPHKEHELIREGNTAAAIVLGGAILGYVIPLGSALSHTASLLEFAAWAVLAGVIQVLTFLLVRHFAVKDVTERIERGEVATAVYLASVSLAVGVINAACMTA